MAERRDRRATRLKPVVQIAGSREQQSATQLAVAVRRSEEAEQRLAELHRYHADYQQGFAQRAAAGLGVRQLQEYQTFLARLQSAINAQRELCEQLAKERDRSREALIAAAARHRALGKLVDKAGKEERDMEAKRMQKESDERAQRTRGGAT